MTTRHITESIRQKIKRAALDHALAEREKTLRKDESLLGCQVYDSLISQEVRRILRRLPSGWLRANNAFTVVLLSGQRHRLTVESALPLPIDAYHGDLGVVQDETLAVRVVAHVENREALRDERRELISKLDTRLSSVRTLSQLRSVWPAGEPFYRDLGSRPSNALAVPTAELNRALGLVGEA